jgi:hypothetical protein
MKTKSLQRCVELKRGNQCQQFFDFHTIATISDCETQEEFSSIILQLQSKATAYDFLLVGARILSKTRVGAKK